MKPESLTLQNQYLPDFHFNEVHRITIEAPREKVFGKINAFDFSGSTVIRLLLRLRGLPTNTTKGLDGVLKMGFSLLAVHQDEELILGLIGRFWEPSGKIQRVAPVDFKAFNDPDFAKVTWNFKILPGRGNLLTVETETRIACIDPVVRRRFARYWFLIKPFSGIIRKHMLKQIKIQAENLVSVINIG